MRREEAGGNIRRLETEDRRQERGDRKLTLYLPVFRGTGDV